MQTDHTLPTSFTTSASLDELLQQARSKYPVHFEEVSIGSTSLQLLQIQDMEAYIDTLAASTPASELQLPFWAKVWPTSLLLCHLLDSAPDLHGQEILEIGAGIGLCGLVAAGKGAQVTISDSHEDALLFARINALQNSLQDHVQVKRVDFTQDRLHQQFDRIIGSEVLYRESSYAPLIDFLLAHLRSPSKGEAILAKSHHFKATTFFELAGQYFTWQEQTLGYREKSPQSGQPERHLCHILRLQPQDNV